LCTPDPTPNGDDLPESVLPEEILLSETIEIREVSSTSAS